MYRKSYCSTPNIGAVAAEGSALAKCLSFYIKVFGVMGKELTGELSCTQIGLVLFKQVIIESDSHGVNTSFSSCAVD